MPLNDRRGLEQNDNFLSIIRRSSEKLRIIARELSNLGSSFDDVSNQDVADRLWSMSNIIYESEEAINGAVGKETHDRYKEAQQSSINLLKACLPVSTIPKEIK